ncbi:hypothetical protein TWF751_008985 [Orbilia oligospora]|nr:hypothetical protein TWF751_008985 [Orbilia oligospora]
MCLCEKERQACMVQEVRIFTFRPKNIRPGYHNFVLSKPHIRQLKSSTLVRHDPRGRATASIRISWICGKSCREWDYATRLLIISSHHCIGGTLHTCVCVRF